ncbi:hypothetical protein AB0C59_30700 [Streptomyces sp. NPDC048664]|uniref:hypothetical protein n=1 Tax=Streptomyces sp. NPDC048664 TaxID=3154505 RepID=UPI00343597E2
MRRFILPVAAIALTAACTSGNTTHAAPASSGAPTRTLVESHSSTAEPGPVHRTAKPKSSTTDDPCLPTRDVILWMKVPGIPDSAQVVGEYDLTHCEPTFQNITHTSPTEPGYCTEAAWASDNPGYDADARPAKHLKKVQVTVGPAC